MAKITITQGVSFCKIQTSCRNYPKEKFCSISLQNFWNVLIEVSHNKSARTIRLASWVASYHDPRPWSNQWLLVFLRECDDIALPQSGQIQGRQQLTSPKVAEPGYFCVKSETYEKKPALATICWTTLGKTEGTLGTCTVWLQQACLQNLAREI